MSGVVPRFERGPVTYQVAEAVEGGQLVEARDNGLVGVAAAGSVRVLGVATKDAVPDFDPSGTTSYGEPVVDYSGPTDRVAVGNAIYPVTFAGAAAFGDKLVAAANGQVDVALGDATQAAAAIVGECREPGGVAAGATGLARIY